jgi:hypothetical protein
MKIGDGFKTRLEYVLEQVFESGSCGGDHQTRAFVAARLLAAAQSGILKLEDLRRVAQDALLELLRLPTPVQLEPQRIEPSSVTSYPNDPDRRSRHV